MYHIEHNEHVRLGLNKQLISKVNKEVIILNRYKNNMEKVNNFTDVALTKLMYHELLAILNSIETQITDIEFSLQQCKLGIAHPSIITTEELRKLRIPYRKAITQNIELNWLLSSTFCSLSDTGLIYYFIKIPLETVPRTSYFLLTYPIKKNDKVITIKAKEQLIIRYKNSFYNGNCIKFNSNHYCKNVIEIKDKCVLELCKNVDLANCNHLEVRTKPIIKLIPMLYQYLTFNINIIETNILNNVQLYHLPSTSLLNLNKNEEFINISVPLTYVENVNIPFISSFNIHNKTIVNTNLTFEELQQIDLDTIAVETLESYDININNFITYVFYLICLYLLFYHIYYQYSRIKRICSQSSNISSNNPNPINAEPPEHFDGRARAWFQYLQKRQSSN